MNKKQKIWIGLSSIVILILCIFMLYKATKKVTYIEYIKVGKNCEDILAMHDNNFVIEQEFKIPYQMFQGVGLAIGTYGRENNSRYEVIIMDKTANKELASFEFNTSQAKDNEFYDLMLDSAIPIDNTHQFSLIIKAKTRVNYENFVAFYADKNAENSENLYYNGNLYTADLCMNVYGGNTNTFWLLFTFGCEAYILALLIYILQLYKNQKSIMKNGLVQAGILGIVVFALLAVFTGMETFCDEVDNLIGGMLIQKGHILYVDYYTQHTPFAYLLCAIFSLFQAGSVMQFRFIYYVIIAFAYMGLYLRHKEHFGKGKMALLPILQIGLGLFIGKQTVMLLSDNIQAICMIALILEFLQYLKDEKLDWKRCSIVSISIFCGFTSAFVSIYAIFAVCLGVLLKEILYWMRHKSISFKNLFQRYWKLVIACAIPFVILLGYLVATHSLVAFYKQAFKFNTEVYSYYLKDGFGSNVLQPFFIGITNFVQLIPNAIQKIATGKEVVHSFMNIILEASFILILINMARKKEWIKAIILPLIVSFCFTRTNESFHSIAAWASLLTLVLIYTDLDKMTKTQKLASQTVIAVVIICIAGNYMKYSTTYLFKKAQPITGLDQKVISETSDGEEIFYDIYSNSSVYLIYKNRFPINRLGFILPWYMDWYELDTIDDLINKRPRVVLYDEDLKAWEISGYDDYLKKYLHENYEQTEETKKIWLLK